MSLTGDPLMAAATRMAGCWLDELWGRGIEVGEKRHLEPIVRAALRALQDAPVDHNQRTLPVPNCDRRPTGVDVLVRSESGEERLAVELKVQHTDQTLWDAYKMVDANELESIEATYLIAAATDKRWAEATGKCTELFGLGTIEHETLQLFDRNARAWIDLLADGSARPTRVPARIRTVEIEFAPMRIYTGRGELRCVRVESASDRWIPFPPDWHGGDWPRGVGPP